MLVLVLACYFLFPLFVYFVYEKIAHRKFWSKGTALTKILCSYSFYFIGLSLSGVSSSIEFYMSSNCVWSGEGPAPCNELIYWIADFVVTWLVLIMIALGFLLQVAYLHFIGRHIFFSKSTNKVNSEVSH